MEELSLRDQVKRSVSAVLAPFPNGLTLKRFLSTYRELEGRVLPVRDLGYDRPINLMYSLDDTVQVRELANGEMLLTAIPTKKAAHVFKFVQQQSKKADKSFQHVKKLLQNCPPVEPKRLSANQTPQQTKNEKALGTPAGFPANEVFRASEKHQGFETKLEKLLDDFPSGVAVDRIEMLFQRKYFEKISPRFLDNFLKGTKKFEIREKTSSLGTIKYLVKGSTGTQGIPDEIKLKIQNTVNIHRSGILLADFVSTYRSVNGELLDFAAMGFSSLLSLLEALDEDVVRLVRMPGNTLQILPLRLRQAITPSSEDKFSESRFGELSLNETFPVTLGAVFHSGLFWWKRTSAVDQIKELEYEMTSFYENPRASTHPVLSNEAFVGKTFAAKNFSGFWQRAAIVSVLADSRYQVRFVDHGLLEKVELSRLRHLTPGFSSIPAQAKKSRLHSVETPDSVEAFKALLREGDVTARIVRVEKEENEEIYVVEMFRDGVSFAELLSAGKAHNNEEKNNVKEIGLTNGTKLRIVKLGTIKYVTAADVAAASSCWSTVDDMKKQLKEKYRQNAVVFSNEEFLPLTCALQVFVFHGTKCPDVFGVLKREMQ